MRMRAHLVTILAVVIVCNSAAGVAAQDRVRIMGRVLDADGAPIRGAAVIVIERTNFPHRGRLRTRYVGRARTNAEGEFTADVRRGPTLDVHYLLDAGWRGMRRVVIVPRSSSVDVRLGPARDVTLEVECTTGPIAAWPTLSVIWERDSNQQRWIAGALIPAERRRAAIVLPSEAGGLIPGPIPTGQTRFSARVRMPVGRSALWIDSHCGLDRRALDVPQSGDVETVHVSLPHPESGAIVVRLTGTDSAHRPLTVRLGNMVVATVATQTERPTLVERLLPGTYTLGPIEGPERCRREIVVRPGATTQIDIDSSSCVVEMIPLGR